MGRKKKINPVQDKEKDEVTMTLELESELEAVRVDVEASKLDKIKAEIAAAKIELAKLKTDVSEVHVPAIRELDADEVVLKEKQINRGNESNALKEKIAAQKKYDNQMITGKFMNRRSPGNPVKLTYNKYIDDPVKWYDFRDGGTYTIPRGFVDQINEHYHTPKFTQRQGPMDPENPDSMISEVDTSNKKYAFVPIGF